MASQSLKDRCLEIVQDLARDEGWQLSPAGIEALVEDILRFVQETSDPDDGKIRTIARNYYQDGPIVQEMLTQGSPDGERLWAEWRSYFVRQARWAQSKGVRPEDAEDLAQEVLIQAHKALHTFRFESCLKTFFCSVFTHCYKQWVRDKKLRDDKEQLLIEGEDDNGVPLEPAIPGQPPSPEDAVIEQMQHAELRRLVEEELGKILRNEDVQILRLYYMEETYIVEKTGEKAKWTHQAIGERFGMSTGTVSSRIWRARERIRNHPKLERKFRELLGWDTGDTDE